MKWDLTDKDYPEIDIKQDHVHGLSLWIGKIAELALVYGGDWNTLVADLWPTGNYSRLVGQVQMKNLAIGYDTGFKVCAYLENVGIVGDSGDDIPLITKWLNAAVANDSTNIVLSNLTQQNPFEIRLSSWGEGDLNDAIKIEFQSN